MVDSEVNRATTNKSRRIGEIGVNGADSDEAKHGSANVDGLGDARTSIYHKYLLSIICEGVNNGRLSGGKTNKIGILLWQFYSSKSSRSLGGVTRGSFWRLRQRA